MEKELESPTIVIYGVGGIGASIGGWLSQHNDKIYLLARGKNAKALKSNGLILYKGSRENSTSIPIKVIEDLDEMENVDIVIIVVKNYDLEGVASDISSKLGDTPIIIALQNGTENQKILPKYFSKIIYGVIVLSGWRDEPGVFGYRDKGEIILGVIDEKSQPLLEKLKEVLKPGLSIKTTKRFQDAMHTKLLLNLNNSIITLTNIDNMSDSSVKLIRKIVSRVYSEGIEIIKAAGYKEYKLKGVPPWKIWKVMGDAPAQNVNKPFKKALIRGGHNSMVQDMIWRQKGQSEIDSLNGYIVKLARSLGIDAPFNENLYQLCKEQFKKIQFQRLDPEIIWEKLKIEEG